MRRCPPSCGDEVCCQAHGWFWGNVGLGASATWWKDEHFEHHAFTNTVRTQLFPPHKNVTHPDTAAYTRRGNYRPTAARGAPTILRKLSGHFSEPFCVEAPLWAQDEVLRETTNWYSMRVQHYTFLPILIVVGRYGLVIASATMMKGRDQWLG